MKEKTKFGAILILAVVFAIGALGGVGGTILFLKQAQGRHHRAGPRDLYRIQVDRMTSRLERSLDLSEEQVSLVRTEIQKFGNAMRELNESMEPQFRSLMSKRADAIEKHLTPEQLEKFRENRRQHQMREKSRREKAKNGDGDRPSAWWSKPAKSPRA